MKCETSQLLLMVFVRIGHVRCDCKSLSVFVKGPLGLSGTKVIEHVRVWNQRRCSVTIDLQPKISRAHAHSCPLEFLQRANLGQGSNLTNGVIIFGNCFVAIVYLLQEVTSRQTIQFLWRPENRHVAQSLGQNFIIGMEKGIRTVGFSVPQEIDHQKDVFWRVEVQIASQNGLPNWRLLSHFDRNQTFPWNGYTNSVG